MVPTREVNTAVAEATLVEGEHLFELRVVDRKSGLSDAKFVTIVVNAGQVYDQDYQVGGELIVPRIVNAGTDVKIQASFYVTQLNPSADAVVANNIRYVELDDDLISRSYNVRGNRFCIN